MASVTTHSLCPPRGGFDITVRAVNRIFSTRGCLSCFHLSNEAGFVGSNPNPSKRELKGATGSFCRARTVVWCLLQQTAFPLLEFTEETGSGVMLPNLNAVPPLTMKPDDCRDILGVLKPTGMGQSPAEAASQQRMSMASLLEPVVEDLQTLNKNLHMIVGAENPLLMAAAEQIFSAGGKRMRPALVLLVSRATAQLAELEDLTPQHRQLAEVIEMIHTASLIHDDVLDESDVRRGKKTIHQLFGTRVAVLAGDFMFAQSSWYLANLENIEVIKLISQVIKDLASGEIKQATSLFDCNTSLQDYLEKSYYKTASLIAASTRSAAIFSGVNPSICDQMFDYGMKLGLAFQIVDDILDFTQSTEQLGKPAGSDLAKGNLTAPVLFALEAESELRHLIETEFTDEGSLEAALKLIHKGGGIEKARTLAKQKGDEAKKSLECLPQGVVRCSLEGMVEYVLERLY